jgi:superkiller protein 3
VVHAQKKEDAVKPSPTELDAVKELNKATKLMLQSDYKEAVVFLKKAIELNPEFSEAYYNLGISYERLGKHKDAIKILRKTIELSPDDPNAYYALGYAYYQKKKYKKAIDAFEHTVSLQPNNAFAFKKLGSAYLKVGKKEKADEQHQVLEKLDRQLADELYREIINQ